MDLGRPEIQRHRDLLARLDLSGKENLVICPETKTKPFLASELFREILNIVDGKTLVCYMSPVFGLVPAEISDIFPVSQVTHNLTSYLTRDPVLNARTWKAISALIKRGDPGEEWLEQELKNYATKKKKTAISISRNYKALKTKLIAKYR